MKGREFVEAVGGVGSGGRVEMADEVEKRARKGGRRIQNGSIL